MIVAWLFLFGLVLFVATVIGLAIVARLAPDDPPDPWWDPQGEGD